MDDCLHEWTRYFADKKVVNVNAGLPIWEPCQISFSVCNQCGMICYCDESGEVKDLVLVSRWKP